MHLKALEYFLLGAFTLHAVSGLILGYIASYLLLTVVAYLSPWLPSWMWAADVGLFIHAIALAATSTVGVIAVLARNSRGLKVCSFILMGLLLIEIVVTIQLGTRRESLDKAIGSDLEKTMAFSQQYYSMNISDSQMWDEIQLEMNCCGVNSYKDWLDTAFGKGKSVPDSCCLLVLPECGQNIVKNPDPNDEIITEGCQPTILNIIKEDFNKYGYGLWLPTLVMQTVLVGIIMYLRRKVEQDSHRLTPFILSDGILHIGSSPYKLLKEPLI